MQSQTARRSPQSSAQERGAEALAQTIAKLSRGTLQEEMPPSGECEDCGGEVQPIEMFGRWHVPSVCGDLWSGPRTGEPVGCLGRRDYQDHLERTEDQRKMRLRQMLANAGLDTVQVRKAKAHGPLLDDLKSFEKPSATRTRTRVHEDIDSLLGDDSMSGEGEDGGSGLGCALEGPKGGLEGGGEDKGEFAPYAAFLHGDYGTGKTTQLILACLHYLRRDWSVRYATQDEILVSLRKSSATPRSIAYWTGFDLLVIDELGYGLSTDWQRAQVFAIVDARYRSQKPLVVASNYTLDEMMTKPPLRRGGLDSANMTTYLGQRTVDRLLEMSGVFPFGSGRHLVLELTKVFRRGE